MRESFADPQAVKLRDGRVLVVGQRLDRDGGIVATDTELWDPVTGTWRKAASLDKVRTAFALVALDDGRALVIGGRNTTDQSFSSAWAFDPDTERWSKVGLMDTARAASAAAVLPDGRVLVAGGYFAYQPDWGTDEAAIRLAAYRQHADLGRVTAPLADVDVPPSGNALATAELFDPRTDTWSSTGSMRYSRAGAAAVTLSDGRVLIIGSTPEPGGRQVEVDWRASNNAEVYDPTTGRFSPGGELPGVDVDPPAWVEGVGGQVLRVGTPVALDDGGALLVGYTEWAKHSADLSTSYRFDPSGATWSEIGEPFVRTWDYGPRERTWTTGQDLSGAVAAKLDDGRVLVAGGGGALMESQTPVLRAARLYDAATDTWSKLPRMPSRTTGATGVLLDDGSVLVLSGRSAVRFVPEVP